MKDVSSLPRTLPLHVCCLKELLQQNIILFKKLQQAPWCIQIVPEVPLYTSIKLYSMYKYSKTLDKSMI